MISQSAVPRLHAITRRLEPIRDLVSLAHPYEPLVWIRGDRGVVGAGEAWRLPVRGPGRFTEASSVWNRVRAEATVDDALDRPASGLVAFGTFAFDDASRTDSVLIVPRMMIGFHDDEAWVTVVVTSGEPVPAWLGRRESEEPVALDAAREAFLALHERAEQGSGSGWPATVFTAPEGEDDAYMRGVAAAAARIGEEEDTPGGARKIVLARRLHAVIPPDADLRVPIARLTERYTDCWTFAVDGMIGASPETLLRSIDGEVTARVLAGTRKRSDDPAHDEQLRDELEGSVKEQLEHRFAVRSLVETLTPHTSSLTHDDPPYLLRLPNVWHLATNLIARLADDSDALVLAGKVHPTAAVAGTPTPVAIRAIAELEPFDRGRYAGAVGWTDHRGDGDWAIALRSAQVDPPRVSTPGEPRTVTAYAGGGILADSDPRHELIETVAKFRPILEAFS